MYYFFFFFFQAEDGIRDVAVTGVQTCALPISAVLLKALAPRDSEQHPPRVLLIEEHAEIALALTATLERRGMQVARASTDEDAVTLAGQLRPNLVVMDLMQVHRRQ